MIQTSGEDLSSPAFLELLFNTIPGLAFVKNEQFEIVKANDAFLAIYPADMRAQVIGSTTVESYSEEDREAFLAHDRMAFAQGYSETIETILFPDGKIRKLLTKKRRFKADGGAFYILGIATDITKQEEALRLLEESNKDLKSFVHIASHDLKAPLANIEQLIAWVEEEHRHSLSAEVQHYFEMIKLRAQRLQRLLNDLLLFSTMSQVSEHFASFNLRTMARDLLDILDTQGRFQLEAPDVEVVLPRREFEIVLRNLISNAIKHHDKPEGIIRIRLEDRNHDYRIEIADDGPGIPLEFSERIFAMFTRLKSQDEVEGSGIGLAIVKRIVEKCGGTIELLPSTGGAVFCLLCPKQVATQSN